MEGRLELKSRIEKIGLQVTTVVRTTMVKGLRGMRLIPKG